MQTALLNPASAASGFLRYLTGLFHMCPHWVAGIGSDQQGILAISPTGARYVLQAYAPSANQTTIRGLLLAAQQQNAQAVLICKELGNKQQLSQGLLELAHTHKLLLWTQDELDYLVLASSMESNAFLEYLGLEICPPQPLPIPAETSLRMTQGF